MTSDASLSVVIVDDDADAALSLIKALKGQLPELQLHAATSSQKALALVKETNASAAVVDLHLNPQQGVESGFALIQELARLDPTARCIVLTGHGSTEHGVRALNLGAANFLQKPADISHLTALLRDAVHQSGLRRSLVRMSRAQGEELSFFLRGGSARMQKVREEVLLAAQTNQPVLILGETGTGKGLCARAIHTYSKRSSARFVRYQPTFATADLVNSDLFGHVRGAFTGAHGDRAGLIKEAQGGSFFLDEIEALPPETQVALLGALQERSIRPVGSSTEVPVDFRLICASNEDVGRAVEEKRMRRDFYHRIAHAVIELPPLRSRMGDIGELARFALQQLREREQANIYELSTESENLLQRHSWPGNVRELEAVVEGAAYRAMAAGRTILEADDIVIRGSNTASANPSFSERIEDYKLTLVQDALDSCGGNQVQAAKLLQIDRSSLRRILKRRISAD